jgi:hypothetical protein
MGDEALERARRAASELDGRWFADFEEICLFAEILIAFGHLDAPGDVVDFFRQPWRYEAEHEVWERYGRPSEVLGPEGEVLASLCDAVSRGDLPLALAPHTGHEVR